MAHYLGCGVYNGKACSCGLSTTTSTAIHQNEALPVRTDRHGLVDPSIFTDDQLRAECSRRGMTALSLAQWSDDLLRAECERRFPHGFGVVHEVTLRERDSAREQLRVACEKWKADVAERDEWKRAAERERKELVEWKRRAKAAEARIANAKPYEFLQSRYPTEGVERGPGIAATPPRDDGHYVDPLDLLCEDA